MSKLYGHVMADVFIWRVSDEKRLLFLIVLAGTLFLSSCFWGESRLDMLNKMNDGDAADALLEQVIEAIKSEDKDALKSMFSETALEEAVDFDDRMEYLFSFFQGEVVSCRRPGLSVSDTMKYGKKMIERKTFKAFVNTDKEEYIFFIVQWTVDIEHPENLGIYALRVIKAEDDEDLFCYYDEMEAGIFQYE